MPTIRDPIAQAWIIIGLGWAVLLAVTTIFRPLLPVDETRYLSVAWEMLQQGHWILPTLNFEPYSHKPPLLFWLIRASWAIFDVSVWPARVMMVSAAIGVFALTARLARHLFPNAPNMPARSMLLLGALPVFLIYSGMIRFDILLAFVILLGLLAILRAAAKQDYLSWLLLGVAIGCGVLAKGPVVLVYILPPALAAPYWLKGETVNWKKWYGGIGIAFLVGACIGLGWAVQAAIAGGADYAQRIFVTQSAGRMVSAFDHREPFWFYLPVLLLFVLPLLTWRPIWTRPTASPADARALKFLACWAIPVFIFFSAISSKQIHYMAPIMPAVAIAGAWLLSAYKDDARSRWLWLPIVAMALPSLVMLVAPHIMEKRFFGFYAGVAIAHLCLSALLAAWGARRYDRGFKAMAISAFMLVAVADIQLGYKFFPRYDLAPVSAAIQQYRDRPLASAPKYDGEYGFTMRADKAIDSIGTEEIDAWLGTHPDGVVIFRYQQKDAVSPYHVLFTQAFRKKESIALIEKR